MTLSLAGASLPACPDDHQLQRATPDSASTDSAATEVTSHDNDAVADMTNAADTELAADTATPETVLDTAPEVAPDTADTGVPSNVTWDLALFRDAAQADCQFDDHRTLVDDGVTLDVWNVSYVSYEVVDGALTPIRIAAFGARPAGKTGIPGIVQAHGLGGFAEARHATSLAAMSGAFVIAYTGPGGGNAPDNTSEGRPSAFADGYRMFDTLIDIRGTWFWGHAVAAMRALTCLEHHPDVNATKLAMTGFSAGAVATLTVAGVDDRVVAAVPLSGTLAWDVATRSPTAWQHNLLALAHLDTTSPEWLRLMELLDPDALLANTRARILMVNGTTDEFFPLTAHVATFDAIGSPSPNLSLAANFDHGCFALTGVESKDAIEVRADFHARGGQRAWLGHHLGTDPRFAELPDAPTLTITPADPVLIATATVDEVAGALDVAEVRLWWSGDDALVWGSNTLERQGSGTWSAIVPLTATPTLLSFVDVTYTTGELVGAVGFTLSSRPNLPLSHVPKIRAMTSCLPP